MIFWFLVLLLLSILSAVESLIHLHAGNTGLAWTGAICASVGFVICIWLATKLFIYGKGKTHD